MKSLYKKHEVPDLAIMVISMTHDNTHTLINIQKEGVGSRLCFGDFDEVDVLKTHNLGDSGPQTPFDSTARRIHLPPPSNKLTDSFSMSGMYE